MLKVPSSLVSVDWLQQHLNEPNLVILDCSIPTVSIDNANDLSIEKIKGARFFDIKGKFSDPEATFPNTFPSEDRFNEQARALGLNNDSAIVCYDDKGIYSSARGWFMFKAFNHQNVAVLDGGLPLWKKSSFSLEDRYETSYPLGNFSGSYQSEMLTFFEKMQQLVEQGDTHILDARSAARFLGEEPEPRKGLRGGHISGSFSVPYTSLMREGKMKPIPELREIFNFFDDERPFTFSCGSGITACVLALAADLIGKEKYSVYDGSWTEWGTLTNK